MISPCLKNLTTQQRTWRLCCIRKKAMCLEVHKFVYVQEDDENTLILRSFYPDAAEGLRRYGVRGTDALRKYFWEYSIWFGWQVMVEFFYSCLKYLSLFIESPDTTNLQYLQLRTLLLTVSFYISIPILSLDVKDPRKS